MPSESSESSSSTESTEYEEETEDIDGSGSDVSINIGNRYSADNEFHEDEDGGIRLMSRTTQMIKLSYSKLSRKQQEAFDQDDIVLPQLLS